jgi:hypothetical protein
MGRPPSSARSRLRTALDRARKPLGAAVIVAVAVVAGACTSRTALPPLPPPVSVPATTTTTVVDFSGIALKAVPGRTTTTIAVQPGGAAISGTVVGPDGPVGNAVVRAERLVGEGAGSMDVITAPDGTYAFAGVLGGRYRLRAWKQAPENLSMVEPQVFFLEGAESRVVNLSVRLFQGVAVSSDIAPNPPVVDQGANLVVQVVDRTVDQNGVVRKTPVPNVRVELFGAGDWRFRSSNVANSDALGSVTFTLDCRRAGQQPLSVLVGENNTFPLDVPPCAVAVEPDTGGGDAASTTTTAAGSRATTTTTAASRATTTTTSR